LLALLNLEEMMENRGVEVGYSNSYRWGKIRAKFGGILSERQKRPAAKRSRVARSST
jgi:transposase-like protein